MRGEPPVVHGPSFAARSDKPLCFLSASTALPWLQFAVQCAGAAAPEHPATVVIRHTPQSVVFILHGGSKGRPASGKYVRCRELSHTRKLT